MKNRITAMLLCLLMAGSAFACGESETTTGDDTTTGGDTTTAADGGTSRSGVPEGTDFGGETVRILNGWYHSKQIAYLNVTETNGDLLNDAIYDRNMAVMDDLNVKLEIDDFDLYTDYAVLRTSILAGDDEWDFLMGMQYRITQLTPEGLFADLMDAPYIDIEQPWWSTQFIENLNIGEKHRYLLSGDYSIGHLNQCSAMFYNKKLYEDYFKNPDELYDIVLEGKWTMDKLYELSSAVAKDVNGDTVIDSANDVFGLGMRKGAFTVQHLLYTAGASFQTYENGVYTLDGMTDTNVSIVEKAMKLLYNNPGYVEVALVTSTTPGGDSYDESLTQVFAADRMLFLPGLLSYADLLRDMESDYGIVPYPTLEEGMDYRALVHNQAMTLAVPTTNQNLELAAAVMEEMAFYGWRDMMPEYYEIVLKQKYMRDDQDNAMKILDMIHDSAWTELAFTYSGTVQLMVPSMHIAIRDNGNFASLYASLIGPAEEALKSLMEFFNE